MVEFTLRQNKKYGDGYWALEKTAEECIKYAKFLSQPLSIELFAPIDENGDILEAPKQFEGQFKTYKELCDKYAKAMELVIFDVKIEKQYSDNERVSCYRIWSKQGSFIMDYYIDANKNKTIESIIDRNIPLRDIEL